MAAEQFRNAKGVAIGFLETTGFTPAVVALDLMEKHAGIRLIQAEINDFLGIVLKITGPVADVETAIDSGHALAEQMRGDPVSRVIPATDTKSLEAIVSGDEYNPLIQQSVVHQFADVSSDSEADKETGRSIPTSSTHPTMPTTTTIDALGFIETQGFTAVFDAIDTACKAANVEVVGKEKLGGGYVTVIIRGDVAAVNAAVDSGKQRVEALGKLIAAHVISRPSKAVLALLPSA